MQKQTSVRPQFAQAAPSQKSHLWLSLPPTLRSLKSSTVERRRKLQWRSQISNRSMMATTCSFVSSFTSPSSSPWLDMILISHATTRATSSPPSNISTIFALVSINQAPVPVYPHQRVSLETVSMLDSRVFPSDVLSLPAIHLHQHPPPMQQTPVTAQRMTEAQDCLASSTPSLALTCPLILKVKLVTRMRMMAKMQEVQVQIRILVCALPEASAKEKLEKRGCILQASKLLPLLQSLQNVSARSLKRFRPMHPPSLQALARAKLETSSTPSSYDIDHDLCQIMSRHCTSFLHSSFHH